MLYNNSMLKEEIIDIMSKAIEKSTEQFMKYQGLEDNQIKESMNWNRPALDYANELALAALVENNLIDPNIIE
jgi:hypothetical protein